MAKKKVNTPFGILDLPSEILEIEINDDYIMVECSDGFYKCIPKLDEKGEATFQTQKIQDANSV